jgi:hypothetical protein
MVRFMSSKRSANWSTAARREEDQVVAKLDLREEEPVLAASPSPLLGGEEGSKGGQPLLPAAQ